MLMSKSRLEKFLYALYSLDSSDLPNPLSRIEELYKCLVTGEEPPTFKPLSRVEKYLMAILGVYDVDSLPNPLSRVEVLLYKLAIGDDNLDDVKTFLSEHEELLAEIIRNGGVGGNIDIEYVLYTLSTEFNTLYNTAEKPVKSAILKGSTKYRDIDTGEVLDAFEDGRNLELVSVKMPVLKVTGKNLFDGELEQGGLTTDTGLPFTGQLDRYRSKNYTKVKTSTPYVVYNNYSSMIGIREFDENYNLVSWTTVPSSTAFTTSNNTKYLKFIVVNPNDDNLVQLEEGSIVTTYEPHKSNILTVNEDVTLRSNGDVYDELNLLTGRLTQRIDENNEVLAQEVVKTVDLSVVDQDGNDAELSTFNDITHITLSSEGLIPEAELEVATKNEEVLNTLSLEMDDVSTTQTTLEETSNTQSENVDATMLATTEIYEQLLYGGEYMSTSLGNLSKILYELKRRNAYIEDNNIKLEEKIAENEENIVFAMMACTELYEMLISFTSEYDYGKDGVAKMASAMVKVYTNLIKRGLKTLDDVPEKLRAEVEEELRGE